MKILVPSAGPVSDQQTVDYVINIVKRLNAQLIVLHILFEDETDPMGEQNLLRPFVEMGKSANVPVESIIKRGEIAATIKKVAFENSVDLMILGVSHGEVVAEWMNAEFIEKTDIPILLIPKWVSAPMKPSPKG